MSHIPRYVKDVRLQELKKTSKFPASLSDKKKASSYSSQMRRYRPNSNAERISSVYYVFGDNVLRLSLTDGHTQTEIGNRHTAKTKQTPRFCMYFDQLLSMQFQNGTRRPVDTMRQSTLRFGNEKHGLVCRQRFAHIVCAGRNQA